MPDGSWRLVEAVRPKNPVGTPQRLAFLLQIFGRETSSDPSTARANRSAAMVDDGQNTFDSAGVGFKSARGMIDNGGGPPPRIAKADAGQAWRASSPIDEGSV
jgi:hypothetical protein